MLKQRNSYILCVNALIVPAKQNQTKLFLILLLVFRGKTKFNCRKIQKPESQHVHTGLIL